MRCFRIGRLISLIVTLLCVPSTAFSESMVFPKDRWRQVPPESQGLNAGRLTAAVEYLEKHSGEDGVRELVIIRNGFLIWKGDNIDKVHGVWSLTKSFNFATSCRRCST